MKTKTLLTIAAVLTVPAASYAQAAPAAQAAQASKACEELKTEIAAKLDAKGVKGYSLEIVDKEKDAGDAKAVGTCEGGTKKILYSKKAAAAPSDSEKPSKP